MIDIKSSDKILVVAPHPDDESIGMGGFLSIYGSQCDVLLVTDGSKGHTKDVPCISDFISMRKEELKSALEISGINNIFFLNIEDRMVLQHKQTIRSFNTDAYSYIFIPNRNETHIDHCVLYSIFKSKCKKNQTLCEYEVWTPMSKTNLYLDISSVIEKKKQMISQYKSQLADCDYVNKAIALNCYRGMYYHADFVEAYYRCDFSLVGRVKHLLANGLIVQLKYYLGLIKRFKK